MTRDVTLDDAPFDVRSGEAVRRQRSTMSGLAGLAAVAATFAAVVALFAISPITLEAEGVAYISSGGGVLSKFHPGTMLAALALGLRCCAAASPGRTAWRLATGDPGIVLLVAAVAIAAAFALGIDKTPVTPLFDTFASPILFFLLLADLDAAIMRRLAICVVVILAANAVFAIAEVSRDWRLIHIEVPEAVTGDPTQSNATFSWQAELAEDWRARALLGHPLVNGLIVGVFILCLSATSAQWLAAPVRIGLLMLEGASMFAFGARAAIVLTVVLGLWIVGSRFVRAIGRGARITPRHAAAGLAVGFVLLVVAVWLADSGFLDRTLDRFSRDQGSASTRLTMFELLGPISWADLVFKPDKDLVATLQRLYGLEFGIESSWLGLTLTYGLVVTGCIVTGLLAFSRSVLRRSARGAGGVLAFFFVLTSVSASMSGKTTTFAMTVVLLMLFLRADTAGPVSRRRGVREAYGDP